MIEVVYFSVILIVLSTFYCLWLIRDVRKVFHIFIIEKIVGSRVVVIVQLSIFLIKLLSQQHPIPSVLPVHSSHGN